MRDKSPRNPMLFYSENDQLKYIEWFLCKRCKQSLFWEILKAHACAVIFQQQRITDARFLLESRIAAASQIEQIDVSVWKA